MKKEKNESVVTVRSAPLKKRKLDESQEAYWREMCNRNNFEWLLRDLVWSWTWNKNRKVREETKEDKVIINEEKINKNCLVTTCLDKPGVWIEDPEKRGFILLREPEDSDIPEFDFDVEIYAALVDEKHRKKGVLRSMFNQVLKAYPNKKIFLFYLKESEIVWRHLGFAKSYYGPNVDAGIGLAYDGRNRKTYFFRQRERVTKK